MKPFDILNLYKEDYPTFNHDIASATNFEKSNQMESAGEKYRFIARKLLQLKLYVFAIDYYLKASEDFEKCNNYQKVIGTELSIYQIHRINNNIPGMAATYEKIASFYKTYLLEPETAGKYYLMSAKHHEDNQNYTSAFRRAKFACECFQETNNNSLKRDSNGLAFRMALQSKYFERAGIYAKKWLDLIPKDYSAHYLSVCMKGYKSLLNTDITRETLMFVNEIIISHYEKKMPQERIVKYLEDAQKLHIKEHNEINDYYNKKIIIEYGENIDGIIKYSIELKSLSQSLGLENLADKFYLQEKDLNRQKSKKNNYLAFISYSLWKYSCQYGTSLLRWFATSIIIIIIFGTLYSHYDLNLKNEALNHFMQAIKPSIKISSVDNGFSPFYYSVVTFATLGYGDITPSDLAGQVFSVIEVLTGYLMLGGLLSVFSKKIIR
jgi:hypothetical protein